MTTASLWRHQDGAWKTLGCCWPCTRVPRLAKECCPSIGSRRARRRSATLAPRRRTWSGQHVPTLPPLVPLAVRPIVTPPFLSSTCSFRPLQKPATQTQQGRSEMNGRWEGEQAPEKTTRTVTKPTIHARIYPTDKRAIAFLAFLVLLAPTGKIDMNTDADLHILRLRFKGCPT